MQMFLSSNENEVLIWFDCILSVAMQIMPFPIGRVENPWKEFLMTSFVIGLEFVSRVRIPIVETFVFLKATPAIGA